MRCLVTEAVDPAGIELLKEHAEIDQKFNMPVEELRKVIGDYDAIIIRAATKMDKETIQAGKKLKCIGVAGIGLDHVDTSYAKEIGLPVFNVPDGSTHSVAELTIGLMLVIMRNLFPAISSTKRFEWDKHGYSGNILKYKTIGILGMGQIGRRVAKILMAFDIKGVVAYDPYLPQEQAHELGIELLSLEDVLKRSDIISVNTPLTPETKGMLGEAQLMMMKPGSYILNIGRGGIIDETALLAALKSNHLRGAAADVMANEPPTAADHELLSLPNFVATPHIGAGTEEAQAYISRSLAQKIINVLS